MAFECWLRQSHFQIRFWIPTVVVDELFEIENINNLTDFSFKIKDEFKTRIQFQTDF